MRVKRIHHLTLAVRDLDGARLTFQQLFDVSGGRAADVAVFGIRTQDIAIGDSTLQLAAPGDVDNPLLRFLERRGEGFYNLALEVEDLGEAIRELAEQGIRVSDPVEPEPGMRSAFVAMSATHGLSLQLVEIASPVDAAAFAPPAKAPVAAPIAPTAVPPPATETADEAPTQAPLDLTPDEWSDTD
jgi:catechol 2,3-dioxygenase-like lactoylglutathione lyase family enzyme